MSKTLRAPDEGLTIHMPEGPIRLNVRPSRYTPTSTLPLTVVRHGSTPFGSTSQRPFRLPPHPIAATASRSVATRATGSHAVRFESGRYHNVNPGDGGLGKRHGCMVLVCGFMMNIRYEFTWSGSALDSFPNISRNIHPVMPPLRGIFPVDVPLFR